MNDDAILFVQILNILLNLLECSASLAELSILLATIGVTSKRIYYLMINLKSYAQLIKF